MKPTTWIAAGCGTAMLALAPAAWAHPGHAGHGLAPGAPPIVELAAVALAAHLVGAGVWMFHRILQKR